MSLVVWICMYNNSLLAVTERESCLFLIIDTSHQQQRSFSTHLSNESATVADKIPLSLKYLYEAWYSTQGKLMSHSCDGETIGYL
jgi:hypothetical protein